MCGFVEVRVWLSREVAGFVDKPFELLMTLHTTMFIVYVCALQVVEKKREMERKVEKKVLHENVDQEQLNRGAGIQCLFSREGQTP